MTTVFLAPDPINSTQFIPGGNTPASGAKLFCYAQGSSTKQDMYTSSLGTSKWSNPVVLDSGGNLGGSNEIWIPAGLPAKFVLAPSNDTDPPASPYWTRDNITGVNDTTSQSEWVAGPAPTFVSATSFTLIGDQTTTFTPGRRLKTTNTSGTIYSTILTSVFGAVTTITVVNDSGSLDAGLSAVSYGIINPVNTASPNYFHILNFGAKTDGTTNDNAAIDRAIKAASGKVLRFSGTPLISSTVNVTSNVTLIFDGGGGLHPTSYLLKSSAMTSAGLSFKFDGLQAYGATVVGQVGNTGDGIVIHADSVTLYDPTALLCGQDGIRIGDDADTQIHFNSFAIFSPTVWQNGRHGLHIYDGTTSVAFNTNAGTIVRLSTEQNVGDGLRIVNGQWNTILGTISEANSSWGVNFSTNATNNFYLGGDVEQNVSGNIQNLGFGNTILKQESFLTRNVSIQGSSSISGQASSFFGASTNPSVSNTAQYFLGAAPSNANWCGSYFSGATASDVFIGMLPNSVSGSSDVFGIVTVAGGIPTVRVKYNTLGMYITNAGGYHASNGLAGLTTTVTSTNLASRTITITDGIITSFT